MSLYWQSMRLTYDPFMAEQANQTPFVSPKWEQQLDLLVHLATSQDSMLLVLGVSGIGKSTMMRQFIENLGHSGGICKIHGGATITIDVLQDLIARHLGFAWSQQDPEQFSSQLLERMGRMRAEGHDFYLVIDNAHKLPKASLALLLELVEIQGGDQHPIHIVLFGGPQLEALIGDITSQHLGEVLTHSIHLEPLNLEYLKNYVEQRLNLAGFSDALPFSQNQLQQIYQISGGIPAKVNSLARQLLLQWTQQGSKKSGDKRAAAVSVNHTRRKPLSVYWYGGAGFAVIAVVLLIMFYFNTPSANAVGNQTLMVNASKDTPQDYDEAGSEANNNLASAKVQTNAAATAAAAVPDSSYTEVDSNGNSAAAVSSAGASPAQSQSAPSDATGADNAASASSASTGDASSAPDTATTSDGMVNSDDDDTSVDSSNVSTQASNTSQTVNQALADNAALGKPVAATSQSATAIGLAASAVPASATASNQTHQTAALQANTSLVTSNASAVPTTAQASTDAEYIPTGSQIPVSATAAAEVAAQTPVSQAQATTAIKPTMAQTEAQTLSPNASHKAATVHTSAAKTSVKPVTAHTAGLDASYFKAQPASHVALQIAGSRDFGKLKAQVASYHLPNQVHYFKTTMNGGPWYVATYGNYASMSVAANAKSSLPAAVSATKPWPRSFQSIQAAINIG